MRKVIPSIIVFVFIFFFTSNAFAFKCISGTKLIKGGESKNYILRHCGKPLSKEVTGYTIDEYNRRELKLEVWVYGPQNVIYHFLHFVGNVLASIGEEREG